MIATWKSFASGVAPDMTGDHVSDVLLVSAEVGNKAENITFGTA
jgi:hypothetical protein